ncbi:transposase, partial [Streptomyces sp. YC419]|nr:transposase [Streptomyces ureilyticus]
RDVAADLNVNPETLRTWVRDADGRPAPAGAPADAADELVRLRAENARLAKAEKEWQLEREIRRRTCSSGTSPPAPWTRSGAETSHTCRSALRGSTSPASWTSDPAGCSAGPWPHTCAPNSSSTRSRLRSRPAAATSPE